MRKMRYFFILFMTLLVLQVFGWTAQAQDGNNCTAFLNQVVSDLSTNCANADPNSVCYGYSQVQTTFSEETEFSTPADRAELTNLMWLQTAPYSAARGEWGLVYMRGHANLPVTFTRHALVYVVTGDTIVINYMPHHQPLHLL